MRSEKWKGSINNFVEFSRFKNAIQEMLYPHLCGIDPKYGESDHPGCWAQTDPPPPEVAPGAVGPNLT